MTLLIGAVTLTGCTSAAGAGADDRVAPAATVTALTTGFARLQAGLDGSAGLAIAPVGGRSVLRLGDWTTGAAWSTIKVPLAVAALRNRPGEERDDAEAAITVSDNDAAERLWLSLGDAGQAANAVQSVLREGGDETTVVQQYPFGETSWALTDQVRFAAHLPCLPQAGPVVGLMDSIDPGQSWGLGGLPRVSFKGGWGPDDRTGAYLARQFGLVPTLTGTVAVAVAAQPKSGSFDDAVTMLNQMTALLEKYVSDLYGGLCRS
ncbi:hypothetical protein EBN03_03160 [Nocardia stercoris]|uniref:Serine hydrolase n=2 Tax=Nocardia stercoris TaxID=2483361 RepID=A0A3M2LKI8_9NOCA|nr:hypothetical protein EBN03_03160 [Nocardia stercoris]